jgi:hypothetical protein
LTLQDPPRVSVYFKSPSGPLVQTTPSFWFLWFLWCLVGLFFISKALLCGFCKGPLLAHMVPPVIIEGRRGCSSFLPFPSSVLPLMGTAAGGVTCCVAEGHRQCDPNISQHHHASLTKLLRLVLTIDFWWGAGAENSRGLRLGPALNLWWPCSGGSPSSVT